MPLHAGDTVADGQRLTALTTRRGLEPDSGSNTYDIDKTLALHFAFDSEAERTTASYRNADEGGNAGYTTTRQFRREGIWIECRVNTWAGTPADRWLSRNRKWRVRLSNRVGATRTSEGNVPRNRATKRSGIRCDVTLRLRCRWRQGYARLRISAGAACGREHPELKKLFKLLLYQQSLPHAG